LPEGITQKVPHNGWDKASSSPQKIQTTLDRENRVAVHQQIKQVLIEVQEVVEDKHV
jgi:hypothetical protein